MNQKNNKIFYWILAVLVALMAILAGYYFFGQEDEIVGGGRGASETQEIGSFDVKVSRWVCDSESQFPSKASPGHLIEPLPGYYFCFLSLDVENTNPADGRTEKLYLDKQRVTVKYTNGAQKSYSYASDVTADGLRASVNPIVVKPGQIKQNNNLVFEIQTTGWDWKNDAQVTLVSGQCPDEKVNSLSCPSTVTLDLKHWDL